jgi:uncharacterized protein YceH (UPF0502 family)
LLRGPQTVGEIRGRTERLYAFSGLDEVQETITSLENMDLVKKLPRQPGRKESRYAHLLSSESEEMPVEGSSRPETAAVAEGGGDDDDRIRDLEEQIADLRQDLQHLQEEFLAFKSQFG